MQKKIMSEKDFMKSVNKSVEEYEMIASFITKETKTFNKKIVSFIDKKKISDSGKKSAIMSIGATIIKSGCSNPMDFIGTLESLKYAELTRGSGLANRMRREIKGGKNRGKEYQ